MNSVKTTILLIGIILFTNGCSLKCIIKKSECTDTENKISSTLKNISDFIQPGLDAMSSKYK